MTQLRNSLRLLVALLFAIGGSVPTSGVSYAAGAPAAVVIAGLPSSVVAGTTTTFTATVVDGSGARVTGYTGALTFGSNFPDATVPPDYTFTSADAGAHQFSATFFSSGAEILNVSDVSNAAINGTGTTSVGPGTAVNYAIDSLTSGSPLPAGTPATFNITAYDQWYNIATGYSGSASISSSDAAATLPPNPIFARGQVSGVKITFNTADGQSVTATDVALPSMTDTVWATISATPPVTITAATNVTAGASGLVASVPVQTGVTYTWSLTNGTITAGQGTRQITYSAGGVGTLGLKCVVARSGGGSTTATKNQNVVTAPATPTITTTSPVTANSAGDTASVAAKTGMRYLWTISGGTITSSTSGVTAGGVNTVTYTAGAAGTLTLTTVEINAAGTKSNAASASVSIIAAPAKPVITAPNAVTTGTTGNTASVAANTGMTYTWTISGGTITSPGGNAGVTSAGTNSVTFTAGAPGTLTLTVAEVNAANTKSPAASSTLTIAAAPTVPVVTAASPIIANSTGNTASVSAYTGMTYSWTISGGTITSSTAGVTMGGANTITYTAGAAGTLTLTAAEINSAGLRSAAGTASVTVNPTGSQPATPTITTPSAVTTGSTNNTASVTARTGMRYQWTISGGSITSAGGTSGITSNGLNSIAFTAGGVGNLTLSAVEIDSQNQQSSPGSATLNVVAAPTMPTITAPALVQSGSTGDSASIAARSGMTYRWTISGGSLTNPGGTAGVTNGGNNSITFTAGSSGSVSLSAVEINAAGTSSASGTATVGIQSTGRVANLYFVAHQDDDIYFFNPDIENGILAGQTTQTVYYMAAGWPDAPSWLARENGVRNAYAAMANVPSNWSCAAAPYAGKSVQQCTLNGSPTPISLIFLRLPDGNLNQLWSTTNGPPFYVTPAASMSNADNTSTYTHAQLIQTVSAIITTFAPSRIGTMDSTFGYGTSEEDHADHESSALFSLEAAHTYSSPYEMRIYRGYTQSGTWYTIPSPEVANLSTDEYTEKYRIAVAYDGGPPAGSAWDNFIHRQYVVEKLAGGTGPLSTPGGGCTDTMGSSVALAACNGSPSQRWTVRTDSEVIAAGGQCLTIGADGLSVQIAGCSGTPQQRWTLFSNGQLRGAGGTCLGVADDGTSLQAQLCGPDTSGNQYLPLATQRFTQQMSAPTTWSQPGDFSDASGVGSTQADYGSVQIADVNGDGYADACVRGAAGLLCALNSRSGSFGALTLWSGAFSDAAGFGSADTGGTLRLVDLNRSGYADACARTSAGIVCALNNHAGGFGQPSLWSGAFSDSAGYGASGSNWRTIRFADIDGDGFADVCGRESSGIRCATNTKQGSFGSASLWNTADFTDAAGFGPVQYSSTMQLGDMAGTRKAGVCFRGSGGITCAVSSGSSFVNAHLWSFRTDFADSAGWNTAAGYYDSIRLVDVNGDGNVDVCARGPNGLVCGISNGEHFDGVMPVQPNAFTDAQGYKPDQYGTTLTVGDLDGNGRADVCARNPSGLVCTLAP